MDLVLGNTIRGLLAFLFIITLSACGGGGGGGGGATSTYTIDGSISGLSGTGLVLQNNGGDDLAVTANGSFTFAVAQANGSSYAVTVFNQPVEQNCTVINDSGTITGANVTNLFVTCSTNTYTIGGSISGLSGNGLVLQNNAGDDLAISVDGNFTFATALTNSSSYAVTVFNQPVGQNCAVTNGNGTLTSANVTNLSVACTNLPTYTIGGSVSGLTGSGLVLQNNTVNDLAIIADGAFTFTTALYTTNGYAITVKTQPTGQFCQITNGSGTLASANVTNASVSCGPIPTYTIGGTVSGLAGTGLVLQNNAGDDLAITVNGAFTFSSVIEEGSTYTVTVNTQPTSPNQTCMVINGSSIASGGNVTTVAVVCEASNWGTAALFEADNRINAYDSRVAIDPNGNAIIVWEMFESPNFRIIAKRFDATSNTWGAAKVITTENVGDAEDPRVAMDANGNAIAVWFQSDGTVQNIWANRYDALASSWGVATLIENNPGDAGSILGSPRIAMHANGDAIIVWGQDTATKASIWSNRYDAASGSWGTAELLENDDIYSGRNPDVAMDANGNAFVVWWQTTSSNQENVWARHYDATAGSWGTAEVIETFSSLSRDTRVSMNTSGDAVVAWRQYDDTGSQSVAANRYDATSNSWGTATYIETRTENIENPVVGIDTNGNALVAWQQSDGTSISIWSNRYDATSASWGTPVVLEKVDGAAGIEPRLVMNSSGNAVATWAQYDGVQRSAWVNHYNAAAGGWAEATPIETLNRYVWYPEIAMNDSGIAIATWSQRDSYTSGTRDNIWVNHYSSVPVTSYIPTFTIGGSVSGLTDTGLVLQKNGGDDLTITTNGGFTFPTATYDGSSYTVTVKNQPNGQFCIVSNGSGVLVGNNITDVTSVTLSCEALPSYNVGGSVSGLIGTGLVLQNNVGDDLTISANGGFTFPTALFGGETYSVTVKTQPTGQACAVTSGNSTITGANITNVSISCATPYTIGGTVSGLTGTGLVLQNNAGDDVVISTNGSFTFPIAVVDGFGYDVRVRVQPAGQSCSVSGGAGTVASASVTTATVNCVNLTVGEYLVSGTASGLIGSGLLIQNNAGDDLAIGVNGSFTFSVTLADTNSYDVRIKSQPTNPRQTCSITSSAGQIAAAHVSNVEINCTTNAYTVQTKVSGLKGSGLVIRNNGGDYIAASTNGDYTFGIALPDTSPYAVSIKTQPSGQSCSVINASGIILGANVADVMVVCRDAGLYSIGGTVTNMRGSWLGLSNNASDGVIVQSDGSFTFPKLLTAGNTYNVSIGFDAVGQTCAVSNGSGTVSSADITSVSVNCVTNAGVNYYTVGGTVTGLKGSGMVLQNNKGNDIVINTNGSFSFPSSLTDSSVYVVSVKKQPTNLNQICSVSTGSGTLAGANVTDVSVTCTTNTYTVRGMITGLEGTGLNVGILGSYSSYNFFPDGSFYYAGIPDGSAFRVRITNQPTGLNQTCTVINGASTINGGDISNLQVSCVTNQYTIGGTLQGMKGSGIMLSNNGVDDITLSANGSFLFPTSLNDGSIYAAAILAQPVSPIQDCLLANSGGTLAGANISNVVVNCNPWTWVSGSDVTAAPGVFGTLGVADPANVPRARSSASAWKDNSGNFWLFGGYSNSAGGSMNDMWKYDPVTGLWTWMKGSQIIGSSAVFGTQGVADPANDPGARSDAMNWQDASGNLWLFSGNSYNDLWTYDTATGNWTWVSGTNQTFQSGIYAPVTSGPNQTPAFPGMRSGGTTWTDTSGNLWLFGGTGKDSTLNSGLLNDLWKYDPINDLWTWESGSDIKSQIGVYGTQGVADALNVPGARQQAVSWVDTSGNLWLFGGRGYDSTGTPGDLNDLWMYDVTIGNWTWVSGSNLANQAGSFGTIGTASASNIPPPKNWAFAQTDTAGNFWLFGGSDTNDLWKYDTVTGLWTWIAGTNSNYIYGIYGTKGVPDALNMPGTRSRLVGWFDATDTLWLFGGGGNASSGNGGQLNDLWKITP